MDVAVIVCLFAVGQNTLAFIILPYLFTVHGCKKGKQWRPSKIETQEGFLLHVKTEQEIKPALERLDTKYLKLRQTGQPLPVIIGDNYNTVKCIVRINSVLYSVENCIKAIDICFKSCHVLNAKYSYQSEHVWFFLEKYAYGLETKWDKHFTSVSSLISDLDQIVDANEN